MKHLFTWGLVLMMSLLGFDASALTVTLEWDIPGSILIKEGGMSEEYPYIDLPANSTSYQFETDKSFGYVYAFAADGYYITGAETTDGSKSFTPQTGYGKQYIIGSVNSSVDGKTIHIDCEELIRDDQFTINVENGLSALSATFQSGYTLDLKKGSNTYSFNPSIDNPLTVSLTGVDEAFSITLNGEPVEKNNWWARYENIEVPVNGVLDIRVYEFDDQEPSDCTLTFQFSEGLEGCLSNIRNWTTSSFIFPDEIEDNTIIVAENTDLSFNLNCEDFEYTSFLLNGEDISSKFNLSSPIGSLRFKVTEEINNLVIEGGPKTFENIEFTGYITNAEGLRLLTSYQGEEIELPEGEDISNPIEIGGMTMGIDDTRKYIISVSEKNSMFFFEPKEGFYIKALYTEAPSESGSGTVLEKHGGNSSISADINGTTFYMIVERLPEAYTANLNVMGSQFYGFASYSSDLAGLWGNPSAGYLNFEEGETTLSFLPGYNTPISFAFDAETSAAAVYMDGAEVSGVADDSSGQKIYSVTPYSPKAGAETGLHSSILIYNSTSRPSMSGASLKLENGAEAEFMYSECMHPANAAGQAVISGTLMSVKPSSRNVIIKYHNEVVHGFNSEDGSFINGLNEEGLYQFNATGNARNNVVTIIENQLKYVDIDVIPSDGSEVKKLSQVVIKVPNVDPNWISMMSPDMEKLGGLSVSKDGVTVATPVELGEPLADEYDNIVYTIYLSEVLSEAGEYSLHIPEASFIEVFWNEVELREEVVSGGYISPEYNGTFIVNPEMMTPVDDYILIPESGSVLGEISVVSLEFPEIPVTDLFDNYDFPYATFSNGETTYLGAISYDWNAEDWRVINIYPMDENYDPTTISEPGNWTLTIEEGAFEYHGLTSPAITAEYTVRTMVAWNLNPEPDSTVESLSTFILSFPEAGNAEFVGSEQSFALSNRSTYGAPGMNCTEDTDADVPTFIITLPDDAQTPPNGYYTFLIDEGAFIVDGIECQEIKANYTLDAQTSLDYVVTPENGTIVIQDYGIDFAFIFDEASTLSSPDASKIHLYIDDVEVPSGEYEMMNEMNMLMFGIYNPEILHEGTLEVVIDANAFRIGNNPCPQINQEWTLVYNKVYEVIVTPAGGESDQDKVGDLSTIYIYFPEASTGEVYNEYGASLKNGSYSYFQTAQIEEVEVEEGVKFALTFNPAPEEDGSYTLSVYEGSIILDSIFSSPEISCIYIFDSTITGVAGMVADENGKITIITIDGRIVMSDQPASRIKELTPGMYVVNGKKVILK